MWVMAYGCWLLEYGLWLMGPTGALSVPLWGPLRVGRNLSIFQSLVGAANFAQTGFNGSWLLLGSVTPIVFPTST